MATRRSVTRWPRRLKALPPDMPQVLREFRADDWQTWPGPGPDPAQEGYNVPLAEFYALPHPVVMGGWWVNGEERSHTAMVGIGDRPELVAMHRHDDARKRWIAARRAWLEEHVSHDAAMDFWIDAVVERRRARDAFYRAAVPPEPPRRGW